MIAVIGAGYAGLAAAYRLQQAGIETRIFEASEQPGGLAASCDTAGDPIERFYHHLSKSEQTIVTIIEELGLSEQLEWRVGKNGFYVDGIVHPLDTMWQIAAYPHLSLYDKLRLGMLTLGMDLRGIRPRRGVFDDITQFDDVPVVDFIKDQTTPNVYHAFFEPLLRAKFGDRAEDVSAAWLLGRIKFRSERDLRRGELLGYLDGGFEQLTQALLDAVGEDNIQFGTRAVDISITDDDHGNPSVEAIHVRTGSDTVKVDVDGVIVATMPHVLEMLTGYTSEIEFQGTICSIISTGQPITGTYWLNIAEQAPFGALIEHTEFVPPTRYGDEHLLYGVRYVQDLDGPFWQQSDAEIEHEWLEAISNMFPRFNPDAVNWIETTRATRTAPIYDLGYLDRVVPYDLSDEIAQGVYYAGMASRAQYPERSLNGAIEAGFGAADCVIDRGHGASY